MGPLYVVLGHTKPNMGPFHVVLGHNKPNMGPLHVVLGHAKPNIGPFHGFRSCKTKYETTPCCFRSY